MRIGLLLERFHWATTPGQAGPSLQRIATRAESAGVDSIWINDHLFQIPMFGEVGDPVLEAYTTLAHVGAVTQRVGLGTLTTAAHYRAPGLLLKMVANLDVLSGGRAWFGIGPAWYDREQTGMGVHVDGWVDRFAHLEDVLQLAHHVFGGSTKPFAGIHSALAEPRLDPPPVRRPPILVGGAKERRLFPLVAKYADACNLYAGAGTDMLDLKLRMLRHQCEAIERPFEDLTVTTYGHLTLGDGGGEDVFSLAQAVDHFGALAERGVSLAIVSLTDVEGGQALDRLHDVITETSATSALSK